MNLNGYFNGFLVTLSALPLPLCIYPYYFVCQLLTLDHAPTQLTVMIY